MELGKQWKIESDSLNVILLKKVKRTRKADKTEYEDWEIAGYFATPANALHGMVKQRIRDTGLKDMVTITKEIGKLHQVVENLPKTFRTVPRLVNT